MPRSCAPTAPSTLAGSFQLHGCWLSEQVSILIFNLVRRGNCVGDGGANHLPEAAANPMHGHGYGAGGSVQFRRRRLVCPFIAFAGQEVLEHRSEERRVGKECRSRWPPYHYK